jgi:glycosyltransferase involved in cell wall biosynthesis
VGLRKAWPDVPIVSRAHGGDVYPQAHGWSTIPFQAAAITSCDRVYCVSEHGRKSLARSNPAAAKKLEVARLGIADIGGLSPRPSDSSLRVLSVSTIDSNKRVVDIASAMVAMAADGVPVYWRHLGDGPEREHVEQIMAAYSGVGLTWDLPGHVPKEAVEQALRTGGFSAFINLSKSEGVPVSLMESQCVGLPVVATRVGGSEEAAPLDINYFVPTSFERSHVTEALRRAKSDGDEMPARRRTWWRGNFDAVSNYQQFADELAKVASANR